jgi:M6 family metalloprotease-like protein
MRAARAGQKNLGSPKIPVLLVEFADQKFKDSKILDKTYDGTPQQAFSNLLHQSGYSYNEATGCVLDFYTDNSNGQYTPVFDVLPVVTLASNMATYGANDSSDNDTAPELAVYQAVKALNSTVDFSQYDNDHDGNIDMILMYYAGLNEAEYGDEDTIWPHQWSVEYSSLRDGSTYIRDALFDGVRLRNYFCTSELSTTRYGGNEYSGYYASKGVLCGIGTTCHEFAHSLGLPDFYDTDYEDNGSAGGTYEYDTMCSGPYNNNGNTPPFFGAEELIMLGWLDSLTDLPVVGNVTIPALSKTDKVAYKGSSSTTGEYFVFECRGSSSWDKYIPEGPGMLVYHVDKSDRKVKSNTAKKLWDEWGETNAINAVGNHPCYYIIPAGCQNYNADNANTGGYNGNPTETTGLHYSGTDFTFGTSSKYSEYTPVDWNKATMDYTLKNISYSSGSVSFSVGFDICFIVTPSMPSIGSTWTPELQNAPAGSKVDWYLDDVKMSGSSFKLTGGKHLAEARVTAGSKTIRVELEFEVK